MDKVIDIQGLTCSYLNSTVLKNIKTSITKGSMTAIIGPNGSGKTTLLKYLIKENKSKECVYIFNKDINNIKQSILAELISFVPQNNKNDYEFTVEEAISLGRYNHNDIDKSINKVNEIMNLVGLENIRNKSITKISGGELQLTMIARAICQDAKVLILDEPMNNLDLKYQAKIMNILTKLKEQNKTILCVLHDLNTVLKYFENTIVIYNSSIYKQGKTEEVITESLIKKVYEIDAKIIPAHDHIPSTVCYNL